MIAAAFAGYACGIAIAFVRVVLRYPLWRKRATSGFSLPVAVPHL